MQGTRSRQSGFTLVELMIVVAVIGILMALAAYNYAGWIGRYRVESFTRELQASLTDARLSALRESKTHCFFLNTAANAGQDELRATYFIRKDENNSSSCATTEATDSSIGYPRNAIAGGGGNNPSTENRVNYQLVAPLVTGPGALQELFRVSPRGMLVDAGGVIIPQSVLKVDFQGECYFTGECNPLTDRDVFPDVDCVMITPTQVNVGLGRIDPATNIWDGVNCDVK